MAEKLRKFANAAAAMAVSFSRPNYFDSGKKGELAELRADLNSDVSLLKKEAMKKVIAGMTIGKDFAPLFAEVLKCMQTDDLELKKLVYLYLMNYAKSQPELALLAINTFIKDSEDSNPLVRALALRTLCCIRITRILDYVIEPLRRGIRDISPYVRKTSAICIAKVFDLSPEVGEECGFLDSLQELLLTDSNPMVVSNVVAAMADIQELCPTLEVVEMSEAVIKRLLTILSDCTEWGQIYLMDSLAKIDVSLLGEVEKLVEVVIPKFQHANQAVVMSAIRLLVRQVLHSDAVPENHQYRTLILRKLSSPLTSLVSSPTPPEIQYAVLRNVNLLLQVHPQIFSSELRTFFCNYNDPQYLKLEKLDVIGIVAGDENVDQILPELSEYAKDVDGEISSRAIHVLARCIWNAPRWSRRIGEVFEELLETGIPLIFQQVTINLAPLLRKESFASAAFNSLLKKFYWKNLGELLDIWRNRVGGDGEAQSAFLEIVARLCVEEGISGFESDLDEDTSNLVPVALASLLEESSENFALEGAGLQMQMIRSSIQLFLIAAKTRFRDDFLDIAKNLVAKGLMEGENFDVKDRCQTYDRLLNLEVGGGQMILPKLGPPLASPAFATFSENNFNAIEAESKEKADDRVLLERIFSSSFAIDEETLGTSLKDSKLLIELLNELSCLSSVYHLPASEFVSAAIYRPENLESLNSSTALAKFLSKLPDGYAQMVRNHRPAVANLLDLQSPSLNALPEPILTTTRSNVDKYANLLDLLD